MKNRKLQIGLPAKFTKDFMAALKQRGEILTPLLVSEFEKEFGTLLKPLLEKTKLIEVIRRIHSSHVDICDKALAESANLAAKDSEAASPSPAKETSPKSK